jgi:iron complex outermembrane recepter protein
VTNQLPQRTRRIHKGHEEVENGKCTLFPDFENGFSRLRRSAILKSAFFAKKIKVKRIYLSLFLLLSTILVCAQSGNIRGKVLTTDNKPASYVNVFLKSCNIGTVTAEDGSFTISNIKQGGYMLTVSHAGLQTVETEVQVIGKQTAVVNILLNENGKQLDEVVVEGRKTFNARPVTIGKAPIAPMDLPQSISVIGQEVIREQQAQRLSDVIKNVNGIYLASTRGSTQENFSARGYSFSNNNMFKDGSRINTGVMPELSSLERVEVLKGSAAILYGNVAPGGIVNMVTKQPKFERGGELSFRTGNYDFYKPAVDFYGPISKNIAYRINGSYETANSYRDNVHSKRYYVNPSLLFKIGNKTELLVQGDYLKHDFTPDFGIGTYNNTKIPNVPRNTFYGASWQYAKTQQTSANAVVKHQINEAWQVNASASYQQYNRDYYSTERIQALANGDWARPLNKIKNHEEYYVTQANLTGKFKTGNISHIFLSGIDADRYYTQTYGYNQPLIYDTINLFDFNKFARRTDIPVTKEIRVISTPVNRYGAYVQDLISLSEKFKLLAGIRWSYQDAQPADTLTFATNKHTRGIKNKVDKAFSPRIGIVYKPTVNTAVFASYANSFSVNSGTDVYGNALAPSIIDQYELGVKNDIIKDKLSLNVTAYRIINNNLAQTAMYAADGVTLNSNTSLKALTGQTTSDGVEVDMVFYPLKGMHILGGYSYNYIRYTKTPEAKGNFIEGERLINNPASTGNASIFYTFQDGGIKGLKIGTSFFYTGTRFAGFNNTKGQTQTYLRNFEVPGYSVVDVSAGYSFRNVTLLARLSNLTNTFNYYVHENYSVNPIAPRQFIATASIKL